MSDAPVQASAASAPPKTLWAFFVRAVRPAVAWVCTLGLFIELVVLRIGGLFGHPVAPLNLAELSGLVLPLMVHQVTRSIEKQAGVES